MEWNEPAVATHVVPWIAARQVPVYTGVTYEEITDKGVRIRTKEGDEKLVEADVVMIIAQDKKNDDLYKALVGRAPRSTSSEMARMTRMPGSTERFTRELGPL